MLANLLRQSIPDLRLKTLIRAIHSHKRYRKRTLSVNGNSSGLLSDHSKSNKSKEFRHGQEFQVVPRRRREEVSSKSKFVSPFIENLCV